MDKCLKYTLIIILTFIIVSLILIPELMSREIIYIIEEDKYSYRLTEFGKSSLYNISVILSVGLLIFNILAVALTRIYYLNGIYYDPLVNIIRAISYFLITISYSLDPIIYLLIDINLQKIIKRSFEYEL